MRPVSAFLDRRAVKPASLLLDGLLALAYTGAGLLLGQEQPPAGWQRLDGAGVVLTVLVSLVLVARRMAPVAVFVCSDALWIAYIACGYWPVVNSMAPLLALYTVAAARPARTTGICTAVVGGTWLYAGLANAENGSLPTVLAQALLFPLVIAAFGRGSGRLAKNNERLAELARRLREEQEARALQAVMEERVRIARELHDVVAHHMSVISLQAGMASYVFAADPPTARQALDTIATTSREALDDMRRLLVLLRVGGPGAQDGKGQGEGRYAPAPGLDRLDELIQRVTNAGTPVELVVVGPPARLPSGMDLCVYRVVQEALTNVLKHAGPAARATVTLCYAPRTLTVCVVDDGRRRPPAPSGTVSGHGLIGMSERARIYGGTVTAGPRAPGGFEVRLTLPAPSTSVPPPASRTP